MKQLNRSNQKKFPGGCLESITPQVTDLFPGFPPSPICNSSGMLEAWQRAWARIAGTNHIPQQTSLAFKGDNVWKAICPHCYLGKRKTHSTKTPENPKPNHKMNQIHIPAILKGLRSQKKKSMEECWRMMIPWHIYDGCDMLLVSMYKKINMCIKK